MENKLKDLLAEAVPYFSGTDWMCFTKLGYEELVNNIESISDALEKAKVDVRFYTKANEYSQTLYKNEKQRADQLQARIDVLRKTVANLCNNEVVLINTAMDKAQRELSEDK